MGLIPVPIVIITIFIFVIFSFIFGLAMGKNLKRGKLSHDELKQLGEDYEEKLLNLSNENDKLAGRWETVGGIIASMGKMKDTELLSNAMTRMMKKEFNVHYTAILLKKGGIYKVVSSEGLHSDSNVAIEFSADDSLVPYLKRYPKVIVLKKGDRQFKAFQKVKENIGEIMIMPLIVGDNLRGILWLAIKPGSSGFSSGERALLSYLGNSLGYIIYNNECIERLEKRALNIITGLAKASEQRDEYSSGHSERVSSYATMFARHIGMSHQEVEIIRRAGLMHDIGKIGISESILNKPGKLTEREFEKVKAHPVYAADFLKIIGFLKHEQILILHHHEKYDGTGYPYGLNGSQIPKGSVILSLCDVFDALTHKQSYRDAYSIPQALKIMEGMREKNFDPASFDQFIDFVKDRLKNAVATSGRDYS